ncbi:MAG: hypothetical protein KHZ77_06685 [Veillonella sp.]|uniref:hypothetical protein n=1 Tax=Veillonella sp. TaxID=1926307 RepID=UPI0025DB2633|nr:hypothetical protein [Veillonella sp.]MBS4913837.1 hypothetical protein [Veillonella sp.]
MVQGNGQPKSNRNIIIAVVVALIVILIGGAAGGYWYYKQTPTYSLKLIRTAVEEHNWRAFEEHVDVETVGKDMSRAFLVFYMANDYVNIDEKLAYTLADKNDMKLYEEPVTESIEQFVRNKKNSSGKVADGYNFQGRMVDIYNSSTIKSIDNIERNGKQATADIVVENSKYKMEFTVKIEMEQFNDGTWEITSITNAAELGEAFYKAYHQLLDEKNKVTQEAIDKAIKTEPPTVKSSAIVPGRSVSFPGYATVDISMTRVLGDKSISIERGELIFEGVGDDKNKIVRRNTYWRNPNIANVNSRIEDSYNLRVYANSDRLDNLALYEAAKTGLKDVKISYKTTRVEFSDGTTLELAKDPFDEGSKK